MQVKEFELTAKTCNKLLLNMNRVLNIFKPCYNKVYALVLYVSCSCIEFRSPSRYRHSRVEYGEVPIFEQYMKSETLSYKLALNATTQYVPLH